MALVFSDEGAGQLAASYLNKTQPAGGNNLTLKLFTSNTTPSDTDTAATYTEAAGGGYAAKTLTAGSWTVSAVGGIQQGAYAQQTFTFTGALTGSATIYGYYIVDADNKLILAERDPSPMVPANNGDTYKVTAIVQFSKGTPT